MTTPYSDLPPEGFWRSGVAEVHPSELRNLYAKHFEIAPGDRIATAGSCFAQHVARRLKGRGFNVVDAEPAPFELPEDLARAYGYGIYSARYGNLYTPRQLLQLLRDAETGAVRADDVWEKDGRFFDALRPSVEPRGLDGVDEALAHRREHLSAVDRMASGVDVLIFTLGLTEAWVSRRSGTVYPICPGVTAGRFDPAIHRFENFGFSEIFADLGAIHEFLAARNPGFRMLLTVSPVPLTATASGQHVLSATSYSKAVLRAACGAVAAEVETIGYFPSYEIVTAPSARGFYYEPNLRSVSELGVETVMHAFFAAHPPSDPSSVEPARPSAEDEARRLRKLRKARKRMERADLVCEERLLDAFARR